MHRKGSWDSARQDLSTLPNATGTAQTFGVGIFLAAHLSLLQWVFTASPVYTNHSLSTENEPHSQKPKQHWCVHINQHVTSETLRTTKGHKTASDFSAKLASEATFQQLGCTKLNISKTDHNQNVLKLQNEGGEEGPSL